VEQQQDFFLWNSTRESSSSLFASCKKKQLSASINPSLAMQSNAELKQSPPHSTLITVEPLPSVVPSFPDALLLSKVIDVAPVSNEPADTSSSLRSNSWAARNAPTLEPLPSLPDSLVKPIIDSNLPLDSKKEFELRDKSPSVSKIASGKKHSFSVVGLRYKVKIKDPKTKAKEDKEILHSVNAEFKGGKLTAIIGIF
jgi:hypothetical protein